MYRLDSLAAIDKIAYCKIGVVSTLIDVSLVVSDSVTDLIKTKDFVKILKGGFRF